MPYKLVIATRVTEEKNAKLLYDIMINTIKWAKNQQKVDTALSLSKAFLNMCQRIQSLNCDDALFLLGTCHYELENFELAKDMFHKACEESKDNDQLWLKIGINLAECMYSLGEFENASHQLNEIFTRVGFIDFNRLKLEKMEIDSKIKALAIKSKVEVALNKFDEAKMTLAMLDDLNAKECKVLFDKTLCYMEMGMFKKAKTILEKIWPETDQEKGEL